MITPKITWTEEAKPEYYLDNFVEGQCFLYEDFVYLIVYKDESYVYVLNITTLGTGSFERYGRRLVTPVEITEASFTVERKVD
jgi:hypothetical protein